MKHFLIMDRSWVYIYCLLAWSYHMLSGSIILQITYRINHKFSKCLKENSGLDSDQHHSFRYLLKNDDLNDIATILRVN